MVISTLKTHFNYNLQPADKGCSLRSNRSCGGFDVGKILSLMVPGLAVTLGRAKRLSGSLCLGTQLGHLQTVAAVIAAMCPELISSRSSQKSVLLPPRTAIPPPWPRGPSLPTTRGGFLTLASLHGPLPPLAADSYVQTRSSWLGLARRPREREGGKSGWMERGGDSSGWQKLFGSRRDLGSNPIHSQARPVPRCVETPAGDQDSRKPRYCTGLPANLLLCEGGWFSLPLRGSGQMKHRPRCRVIYWSKGCTESFTGYGCSFQHSGQHVLTLLNLYL